MLKPLLENKDRFWVTFDKEDARSLLKGEKVYSCYYPTNRNVKNLLKNTAVAWKVLRKERPDLIISSGAAVAVPFFYLGKLLGAKLIYIEVFDRIDKMCIRDSSTTVFLNKIVGWTRGVRDLEKRTISSCVSGMIRRAVIFSRASINSITLLPTMSACWILIASSCS